MDLITAKELVNDNPPQCKNINQSIHLPARVSEDLHLQKYIDAISDEALWLAFEESQQLRPYELLGVGLH